MGNLVVLCGVVLALTLLVKGSGGTSLMSYSLLFLVMILDLPKVHTVCSFLICVCHISFSPPGMEIGWLDFLPFGTFYCLG